MADDLRVESLTYSFLTEEGISISENASPVTLETEDFAARLERDTLSVSMKTDFRDEASAREAVEPHIRAWEVASTLRIGRPEFSFRFNGSHIINRAVPPGTHDVRASGTMFLEASGPSHVTRGEYPHPPSEPFSVSPEVEMLHMRWAQFIRGGDTLLGMAYFCLTLIEVAYGGGNRATAKATLRVSRTILDTVGRLTDGGDPSTARKFRERSRALTADEDAWVRAAIPLLILRAGRRDADAAFEEKAELTMSALPPLASAPPPEPPNQDEGG
jgi:hypothetical protein